MFTKKQIEELMDKLNVNKDVVSVDTMIKGIKVELEHGKRFPKTNVTDNDLILTAKIALAHLLEFPDYYERLEKMEKEAEEYWKNKRKPRIFKTKRKK